MKKLICLSFLFLSACGHQAVLPEGKNVKALRENPPANCTDLGAVEGRNANLRGETAEAIEDLKNEAAKKGANYVRVEATSAYGNSVRGTAFQCP